MNYLHVIFQIRIRFVLHQNFYNFDISLLSSNMQRSVLKKGYVLITMCRITFLYYSAEQSNLSLFVKQSIFYLKFSLSASSSAIQKILLLIKNKPRGKHVDHLKTKAEAERRLARKKKNKRKNQKGRGWNKNLNKKQKNRSRHLYFTYFFPTFYVSVFTFLHLL